MLTEGYEQIARFLEIQSRFTESSHDEDSSKQQASVAEVLVGGEAHDDMVQHVEVSFSVPPEREPLYIVTAAEKFKLYLPPLVEDEAESSTDFQPTSALETTKRRICLKFFENFSLKWDALVEESEEEQAEATTTLS